MTTKCRFSTCDWTGSVDEIFVHCESYHPRSICEHKNKNYYDFTIDDLQGETFLLIGKEGIYWFCSNPKIEVIDSVRVLKRGVFHIGESEPINYTLKLGTLSEGHTEYLGDYTSRPEDDDENNEVYDLEFPFTYLEYIDEVMISRKMRLYVGEFDDSGDQYVPDCDELVWTSSEEAINAKCLERFCCPICLEYIRRDARFCESQHFVCLSCFEKMLRDSKLKCPICRAPYPYNCHDPEIEELLKMVKFPDTDEHNSNLMEQGTSSKRRKK